MQTSTSYCDCFDFLLLLIIAATSILILQNAPPKLPRYLNKVQPYLSCSFLLRITGQIGLLELGHLFLRVALVSGMAIQSVCHLLDLIIN